MNILIDIGHPGHIHLFRNAIKELENKGHKIYVTSRDVKIITHLLNHYEIRYINLGDKGLSVIMKGIKTLLQDFKVLKIVFKYKIDLGLSSGIVLSHVAKFSRIKTLIFDDDDDHAEPLVVKYGHPFADNVLSPIVITRKAKSNIGYFGTHELSYLHPKRFAADINVLNKLKLKPNDVFFVLRFVAFQGHHDIGQFGISLEQKIRLTNLLSKYGKVFITSEKPIEIELEKYRIPVPPEDIHSLLFYATMFLGDSQTMTSEAAILGTPALKCNTFAGKLSVPNELEEKYGLCYSYHPKDFDVFFEKTKELLSERNLKEKWSERRKRFIEDKIDVTAFMVWFIENYPESAKIMKDNPDYQYKFK